MFNLNLKKALELMLDNTTGLDSSRSHCGWGNGHLLGSMTQYAMWGNRGVEITAGRSISQGHLNKTGESREASWRK